ncbi:MAG TPA: sigma-70 family RNA polymerase sigma factor [Dongiaceae bacterium]|nr:sigma-70 family RNA polymerase sigma factor [Dongiaceae bacterium]
MIAAFDRDLIAAMPNLRPIAMKLTRNRAAADDLIQDTLERAWRALDHFQPGTNLGAWLSVIMRHCWINGIRASARRPTVSLEPDLTSLISDRARQEDAVFFHEIMAGTARLPWERRVALYLAGEGETYEAIAQVQEAPIGTIRSRVSRARREMMAWAEGC